MKGEITMKKYETPEIMVEEILVEDVIAAQYTEGGSDNETSWLYAWTSGINKM